MTEFITYTCGKKSYPLCFGQWTAAVLLFTVFTKFFIWDEFTLDELGDIHLYSSILLSFWILGWLAVLLLGFLKRYFYCLTIEFHTGGEYRIVERSFFYKQGIENW